MAKQTRDTQIVSTKGGKLMQRESIDDTLLPDADELKKYKEIDPKVLDFILSRTSIEQDFRHQFNEKALAEQTTNNKRGFLVTMWGMVLGAIIILVTILSSTYLILNNHEKYGAVLVGTSIISAVIMFVNKGKAHTK